MMRRHRRFLPDIPIHIVLYGYNHRTCFYTEDDYRLYLYRLAGAINRHKVKLHSYVLMPNHVHLLMSANSDQAIDEVMHLQGQHYRKYIQRTYGLSGQLWQSNYRASYVDAEDYLLRLYHYIETNPVRSGMADIPEEYTWSSYHYHAHNEMNPLIQDHNIFTSIADTSNNRNSLYREMCQIELSDSDVKQIQFAYQYEIPLGNKLFKDKIHLALQQQITDLLDEGVIHDKAS